MAIGRHKSRSRGMTIITIIFLLVSLRLIWLSSQSMSAGSAREESRYPIEKAGLRIPDTRIVTKQELIINQLDRDLDAKITEKVMKIKDRDRVPTFSDAEKLFVQVENIQNNVGIKSGSDRRRVVIHEDIAVRDDDAHITKASTTIKPTSSPTVVTNRENSAEQSNTVTDSRGIQVKPTHNVTLTSKSPRTIIVHTNNDNVVEFTKEQLDYGNFIDNEEEKRNNHTLTHRKVEQDNATVTAENLTEKSNQTITIKTNDNVEEHIVREETRNSTTDNSTDNVKQENTKEIATLQTEETNQTALIKNRNNVGEGVGIKENTSTMIHTDNVKQEKTKVISTRPTKETNQTTTMKSNAKVEEEIVINKQYNKPFSVIIKDDLGHCQRIIPWGQPNHALISTFYLPSRGNYTIIDDNGNYPIPVKTVAEVTDPKVIEPVTVILVPFSHADPGYGLTIEQYYTTKTKSTLDNMITKLKQYPDMTFQWAETVYLARWFKDLTDDKKKQVRELISRGQLEIVLGGWVMPDEASTRYVGVVDQLIEGHQWLNENLGVKPEDRMG